MAREHVRLSSRQSSICPTLSMPITPRCYWRGSCWPILRNVVRFPADFMFKLSNQELMNLRCQIGTSSSGHGGDRYLPLAFTEQGVAMLSSVLNSERAVAVNIEIMRAFIHMRQMLTSNEAMKTQLEELERKVATHDQAIVGIFKTLHELMSPQQTNAIGFTADISPSRQRR